jgi:hypothetical protein
MRWGIAPPRETVSLNDGEEGFGPHPRIAGLSLLVIDRSQQALSDTSSAGMVTAMIFTSSAIDQLRA